MIKIKNIWRKTFLGKLLSDDPIMGRVIAIILAMYLCIHFFKLEVYPFYMFAMYSKPEVPKETYQVYKIYNKGQQINLEDWNYRKYTVLMNTIQQYDAIMENNMIHPEASTKDKFVEKLGLTNSTLDSKLSSKFRFNKENLQSKLASWIGAKLDIKTSNLSIEKEAYQWNNGNPLLKHKVVLYEVD